MNDAAPLEPDELDELLSADLDGELAAAAREQGSDVETIRARIAATPGATDRRTELAAARDVLAERPEFDELLAARLRAKAVRAAEADSTARDTARRDRRKRAYLTVSGIAASIVLVAAVALAVGRAGSSSGSKNSSAAASSGSTIDLTRPVPALGSYTDVGALGPAAVNAARRRAAYVPSVAPVAGTDGPLSAEKSAAAPAIPTSAGPARSNGSLQYGSSDRSVQSVGTAPSKRAAQPSPACSAARYAGPGDRLLMQASATLNGRPVGVFVFEGRGETTVVVLGKACEVVNVQMVG
jgi:hypothetical protein